MITHDPHGILFVVSAPSGAGKTTLCDKILAEDERIKYSVSCTTRSPRDGEEDGKHYHFLTEVAFAEKIEKGAFLEHARVHDYAYGTLRKTVEDILHAGNDVLMDVDVQGAVQLREGIQAEGGTLCSHYADVFIAPPTLDALRDRLKARGKDSAGVVALRLENARIEMEQYRAYKYLVVNEHVDSALIDLRSIVCAERKRIRQQ